MRSTRLMYHHSRRTASFEALVNDISRYHEFTHFVNDGSNFFNRFNSIAMELFTLSMLPSDESGVRVMEAYNKPRSKERGASCQEVARNLYWIGVTHTRILELGLQGGGPADSDAREGHCWRQIYGVPFDLFVELSNTFEAWMEANGRHTYLKNQLPCKLMTDGLF
jgi:hypothetical protein